MPQSIPTMMHALELRAYDENFTEKLDNLAFVERKVPPPGKGQVLVRMAAAPINPSDLGFLRGLYVKKPLPAIPGIEGSGVVVAADSGFLARWLMGKRVTCIAPFDGDGTWAEYMVTSANFCIPLRKNISLEQGASLVVNPLTAWALMEMTRHGRHRAVIQTAAASALGRMILRLGKRFGIPVINVVRRQEQVDLLQALGAKYVLNSSAPNFDDDLKKRAYDLQATLALDAIAGDMTQRVLQALPKQSRVIIYGALSEQGCLLDPRAFIFEDKQISGFWLTNWSQQQNPIRRVRTAMLMQKFLAADLKTEIRARLPLKEAGNAVKQYASSMTEGKILFIPNPDLA
jgi:NADPH:quinone reductase-like Zn-dependent oxidoreductase